MDEAKVEDCFNDRSEGFSGTDFAFVTGLNREGAAFGFGLDKLLMLILCWLRAGRVSAGLRDLRSQRLKRSCSNAASS